MLTKHRIHLILLVLILAVGFALRLLQPTLVEFKRDEATIARLGQAIAYEGYLPAVGVDSSLGIDNLPLTLYLAALPLRVWADPLSVVLFTCLLNSLALLVCYWLTRAGLGKTEALLATLLFSVSPWAVLYARKIWSRTLPIFTLAFVVSLFLTFVLRRKWALVAAFVSLAGLLGLQLEALAFVPILGLAILLYRDAVTWRPLLVGVVVFCLLMLPYAVYDARQGWQNARGLLGYAGGDGVFSWDAVRYALSLLGGQGIEGQAGPFYLQFLQELGPFWWLNHVLSVLFAASLVHGIVEAFRSSDRSRRRTFTLMLLWFFVPILLQLEPSTPTQRHYYVMHYPVQYMFIGAFLVQAATWVMRWATAHGRVRLGQITWGTVAAGLALGCGWQILVTAHLRGYMVAHPTTGGYGIPLRYTRAAASEARALAPDGEIIVLAEDTRPFMTETPTVFDALLFTVPHRFADGRSALPLPQREQVAYIVGPLAPPVDGDHPWEVGLSRLASLSLLEEGPSVELPDGVSYKTYEWTGADRSTMVSGMTPLAMGIPFANNVVFAAYEAPARVTPGESFDVWLAWWLRAGAPQGVDYHFTVQFFDAAGGLVSQDDHAAFPSDLWQMDDLVLSRFGLSLPPELAPGTYRLRAGMYSYPDIQSVAVVDPEGRPVDDGIVLTDTLVVE